MNSPSIGRSRFTEKCVGEGQAPPLRYDEGRGALLRFSRMSQKSCEFFGFLGQNKRLQFAGRAFIMGQANVKGVCAMKFVCKNKRKCMTAYLFLFEDTVSI